MRGILRAAVPAPTASFRPHLKISPAKNGAILQHFTGGVEPGVNSPRKFIYPNGDALAKHIARAARRLTMGNKLKGV